MNVINTSAPFKERPVKLRTQEWFDRDIANQIDIRESLFKKFKKSRLHIDEQIYKDAKYQVDKLFKDKKINFIEQKLNENIGKPRELRKIIKSLGLPSKIAPSMYICLKNKAGDLIFDPKENANIFKNFFSKICFFHKNLKLHQNLPV